MNKQVLNIVIIGGGKGCFDILKLLKSYPPTHLLPHVLAVVDVNPDAVGRRHAERLGIPCLPDYIQFLQDKHLDLIIELTGNDSVLRDISEKKLDSIKLLDHVGALFLWEIIAIQKEKLHLENKVSDLNTMAAIGEISYRLTHELRNPLMIIGGHIRRLMTRFDLHHGVRKRLKHISKHVQHLEEVISDTCEVVRPLYPHYELTEMTSFFTVWCNRVNVEARLMGFSVETQIEENLPTMYIDPSLLRQALWYILENSLEAMAEKGSKLSIKAILCWDCIHIEITDTGSGFNDMSTTKAIEPLTTTKDGKMGLGLSLCRQIVMGHNGNIEIVNEKDIGATVIIEIPITFEHPSTKIQTDKPLP
jgi:signal transduction histidine kinase